MELLTKGTPTQIANELGLTYNQVQKLCRAKKNVPIGRWLTRPHKYDQWRNLTLNAQRYSIKTRTGKRIPRYTVYLWGERKKSLLQRLLGWWPLPKGDDNGHD